MFNHTMLKWYYSQVAACEAVDYYYEDDASVLPVSLRAFNACRPILFRLAMLLK